MDIMELGAIGELVGDVAVIGSLLYVGFQVRQSNTQAEQRDEIERAESHRAQSRDGNALFMQLTDLGLANVFRRGLNDFGSLSFDEQGQLEWWLSAYTIHTESVEFVSEGGLIDSSLAERWHLFLVGVIKSPGGGHWWAATKARFHPVFVKLIDGMANAADSTHALRRGLVGALPGAAQDPRLHDRVHRRLCQIASARSVAPRSARQESNTPPIRRAVGHA